MNLCDCPPSNAAKTALVILCVLLGISSISAQEYNHTVHGSIADVVNGDAIAAKVYLLNSDSTVIDTVTAEVMDDWTGQGQIAIYEFKDRIRHKGHYIIKAVKEGYEDTYADFELRSNRETVLNVKKILMARYVQHELSEVVVRATKIKMVMRGDTIVYNADAFNLAEGSMLDALIARLPGARLTKEGQIFVNGKLIQSLLLNGRDFFSGNAKMALENLPAYTINKLKVYHKQGEASQVMGRNMGDETYVMDVKLKKEYNTTILGNIEAGVGSNGRYRTKAFAMKNSQKEILFGFANVNNLNDNAQANMYGAWTPEDIPNGLLTNRTGNLSYMRMFDGNMQKWVSTQNTISHNNADIQKIENTEIYLPTGNIFNRVNGRENATTTVIDSRNVGHFAASEKYSTTTFLTFHYNHNLNLADNTTASSRNQSLLNRLITKGKEKADHYNVSLANEGYFKTITDMLRYSVNVEYDRLKDNSFSLYDLTYTDGVTPHDFRNNYRRNAGMYWKGKGNVSYEWIWPGWSIRPMYEYNYRYDKANNNLYRLDKIAGADSTRYDLLPSTVDALLAVQDNNNSYLYRNYQNHHKFQLELNINRAAGSNKWNIETAYIRFPLRLVHKNISYYRTGRYGVSRHAVFFEPELFARGGTKLIWEINAGIKSEIPGLVDMIDYRDDSDPLNVTLGNSALKNIHRYNASFSLQHEGRYQRLWNVRLLYNKVDNNIAYATTYDAGTNAAVMQPVSVNGNWNTAFNFDYTQALDSARQWTIDNQLSVSYNHNVDMATVNTYTGSVRSIVNNWQLGDNLKLTYRPSERYEFSLHGGGTYFLINSDREGFKRIHAGNYKIGFNTVLALPWHFSLNTDIALYARRGYQDNYLNTTEWVWNAELARSFFHERLLAKLSGFDILRQLSNTKYVMNEQGRTERWYNTIPRYVMFSLVWKFTVSPKNRGK